MKAIIVEDEKKGREVLQQMILQYCAGIEVIATAANGDKGFELISRLMPDLVFLDIQMPDGTGFDLLRRFNKIGFHVIFTTAYDQYALEAIKHHALDYLIKPIDIDELVAAVDHAKRQSAGPRDENRYRNVAENLKLELTGRIALAIREGIVYIPVADIIRIESDAGYSTFYTVDTGKYIVAKNLKDYEDILPGQFFFRIHKSHLVNIRMVRKFIREDGFFAEMMDGSIVEIARRKKEEFLLRMANLN